MTSTNGNTSTIGRPVETILPTALRFTVSSSLTGASVETTAHGKVPNGKKAPGSPGPEVEGWWYISEGLTIPITDGTAREVIDSITVSQNGLELVCGEVFKSKEKKNAKGEVYNPGGKSCRKDLIVGLVGEPGVKYRLEANLTADMIEAVDDEGNVLVDDNDESIMEPVVIVFVKAYKQPGGKKKRPPMQRANLGLR